MNSVHNFPQYFPTTHYNTATPSTSRSSKWSHPLKFFDQDFVRISHRPNAWYMPTQLALLGIITLIISGAACRLWSSSSGLELHFWIKLYNQDQQNEVSVRLSWTASGSTRQGTSCSLPIFINTKKLHFFARASVTCYSLISSKTHVVSNLLIYLLTYSLYGEGYSLKSW
jgi:hypothetical protein